ncbi:fimbrial biogenesis chaperone [Bdellovibrio reynosensis]|uniref:Fimbria/pilus periplasmic chaperone n=1 Tax=Bdellovibrio reynosensis TaxID=2835041 RepID=A0ABY4C5L4_9BACT|nr:fimbria/pilus periplasmic chaperone [Bdellovibrio reynosensis]UOF00230.1 fimbria/pilus periplasmic chaperone [Bdellovibrio reynosensis]
MPGKFSKFAIFLFLFPTFCFAFRLTPMVVHFAPSGAKSTQVLTVENTGTDKIPIQIEAFTRTTDAKGEEVRKKTEDFTIYPEQLVLLPKEKRNIRVTWAGELNGNTEKAYRIVAAQLPIEFHEKNAKAQQASVNLKFLLQYVASAYVTPQDAVSKIRVTSVEKKSNRNLVLKIKNEGTAHQVLRVKQIKIFAGDKLLTSLEPGKSFDGVNILAGAEHSVPVASAKDIVEGNLKAELELAEFHD